MADIQSPTAEIRRGNKKRRKKKQHENIYGQPYIHRATIKKQTCLIIRIFENELTQIKSKKIVVNLPPCSCPLYTTDAE